MAIAKPLQNDELSIDLESYGEINFPFQFWDNIIKLIDLIFKGEADKVKPFTALNFKFKT